MIDRANVEKLSSAVFYAAKFKTLQKMKVHRLTNLMKHDNKKMEKFQKKWTPSEKIEGVARE